MKILFPTGSFFPAQTGGPDNTVYWITKALKEQGVEVEVVSTERGLSATIPRNEWLKKDYADVMYTTNLVHYFPVHLILAALSRLKKVDVLHLSMIFYPASFLIAIFNVLFTRKPIIWSIHGDLDPHMMKRSHWKKFPIAFLIKNGLKHKVVFHSTCDEETQYVKNVFGQDVQVVQLTNYMELPVPAKVKKENFFLYLGRIDPKKAIENLIEAFHQSDLFIPSDFQLKIAGNHQNAYGKQLVELVKRLNLQHKVKFIGHISGEAKQRLLARAHFLFMPSHTENFGIVVTEALAQGTPAVASKQTPWSILEERQAGFWVDNDVENLKTCIDHILKLPPKVYQEICKNTRPLANESFNIKNNIYKWQKVYGNLIHKTKQSSGLLELEGK